MHVLKDNLNLYPVWIAIGGQDKLVVAQAQQNAIDAFILHYNCSPSLVINGLYAAVDNKKIVV